MKLDLNFAFFLSCVALGAVGCAGNEVGSDPYGETFDENGRADSARTRTNPGKLLMNKLLACDADNRASEGGYAAFDRWNGCYARAVDAAGWTIEWRIQQYSDGATFVPGSIAGADGELANERTQWAVFCDAVGGAYQFGEDSEGGASTSDPYLDCIRGGESAYAATAMNFAFEYYGPSAAYDALVLEAAPAETRACEATLEQGLQSFESAEAARDLYLARTECVRDALAQKADEAEAYANLFVIDDSTAPVPALADAVDQWLSRTHALCIDYLVASMYGKGMDLDDVEGDMAASNCEAMFARYAFAELSKLEQNAGGSFARRLGASH